MLNVNAMPPLDADSLHHVDRVYSRWLSNASTINLLVRKLKPVR